jgi:hypothetical protein
MLYVSEQVNAVCFRTIQCCVFQNNSMLNVSEQVNAMGPLIDQELEKVDRKHAQLTQLSSNLVEALNLYHTLMREPAAPQSYHAIPKQMNYNYSLPPSAQVIVTYVFWHVMGSIS